MRILLLSVVLCPSLFAFPLAGLMATPNDWAKEASYLQEKSLQLQVEPGSNLYTMLQQVGVDRETIMSIVRASKDIHPLNRLTSGTRVVLRWWKEELAVPKRIDFMLSPFDRLVVERNANEWKAKPVRAETEREIVAFSGYIRESFWESSENAGMPAPVTIELADVFASMIDFARETRVGDRWRLLVEKIYADGVPVGWGRVVAAEFENQGIVHSAVRFERADGKARYYSRDGNSLMRKFLKSPMKFGRITSRFSQRRFHPILKIRRPHLGIDYGAPTGTPVLSVGDGRVLSARWEGGGGKTVKIFHGGRYKTAYRHLKNFASGIRPGASVSMGQVIGYVGSTGRVTGPHLHFEFYLDDRYVDPLGVKFPSADPLPKTQLPELQTVYDEFHQQLPPWADIVS